MGVTVAVLVVVKEMDVAEMQSRVPKRAEEEEEEEEGVMKDWRELQ